MSPISAVIVSASSSPTPGTVISQTKTRHGKANPAKSAVARKVLIACWHVLARQEAFKPATAVAIQSAPASSTAI